MSPQSKILEHAEVRANFEEKAGKGGRQVIVTIVWDTLAKAWCTQVQIMRDGDLQPARDADILLAAALFRDYKGYPRKADGSEDRGLIGSSKDEGDFFKGRWVRGKARERRPGVRFGPLKCWRDGLECSCWDDGDAVMGFAAAGSPISKT